MIEGDVEMREILFRGKCEFDSEWMYGWLYHSDEQDGCTWILDENNESVRELFGTCDWESLWTPVVLSTVGQYTGLLDKNSTKIFEGDIVHILGNQDVEDWKNVNYIALIMFIDGGFCAIDGTEENHSFARYSLCRMDFELEVIGNIYDNPELLKGEM